MFFPLLALGAFVVPLPAVPDVPAPTTAPSIPPSQIATSSTADFFVLPTPTPIIANGTLALVPFDRLATFCADTCPLFVNHSPRNVQDNDPNCDTVLPPDQRWVTYTTNLNFMTPPEPERILIPPGKYGQCMSFASSAYNVRSFRPDCGLNCWIFSGQHCDGDSSQNVQASGNGSLDPSTVGSYKCTTSDESDEV